MKEIRSLEEVVISKDNKEKAKDKQKIAKSRSKMSSRSALSKYYRDVALMVDTVIKIRVVDI